ncbi:MAG: serine hydrolase domain-containing protein, partial [Ekhidna sp.]
GLADVENNVPVNNESLFRIASISKVLTVLGVLKLIENDQLTFSDKVFGNEGILEYDFGTPPYPQNMEEITVLHLLEHKSGWKNTPYDPVFRNEEFTQTEMINEVIDNRPNSEPGGDSYYLNFGYILLGRVIEKVSGLDYESYINQKILNPIGIDDMAIASNSIEEKAPNEVIYYPQENFDPYTMNVRRMDAAGGWIASTKDLTKLLIHIDRNTHVDDILTSSSLDYSYLAYSTWIFNGGFAGTNSSVSRINNELGSSIIVNTRIPGGEITSALNDFMTEDIDQRLRWAPYDLFLIESEN